MAKYLDLTGLAHLWGKVKTLVEDTKSSLKKSDVGLGNVTNDAQVKRTEMGKAGGVATLGDDGKVPTSQLPEIDLSLYKVVTSLPTTGIDANKIYLVLSQTVGSNNKYIEYMYVNGAWEILGEYKASIDLTPYVKFTDLATAEKAGAMSAADKKALDDLVSMTANILAGLVEGGGTAVPRSEAFDCDATSATIEFDTATFDPKTGEHSFGGQGVVLAAATTQKAGAMSATDKSRIDSIYNGDLPLVTPVISVTWTAVKNDGSAPASGEGPFASGATTSTDTAINIEKGWKVGYSATYKWTSASGKKNPTAVYNNTTNNFKDKALPANGANSAAISVTAGASAGLTTNTTLQAQIQAAKKGLMVSDNKVVPASGNDVTTAKATVTFLSGLRYGVCGTASIGQSQIAALGGKKLVSSKSADLTGVTATTSQYYVIAYPKALGALSGIVQDGATPVLTAFTRTEVSFTNDAGYAEIFYVYRSNNMGAFTGASLKLS